MSSMFHTLVLRQDFSLLWSSLVNLGWVATELQGHPVSVYPSTMLTVVCTVPNFLTFDGSWVSELKTEPSPQPLT